jgi:hypothetical protein
MKKFLYLISLMLLPFFSYSQIIESPLPAVEKTILLRKDGPSYVLPSIDQSQNGVKKCGYSYNPPLNEIMDVAKLYYQKMPPPLSGYNPKNESQYHYSKENNYKNLGTGTALNGNVLPTFVVNNRYSYSLVYEESWLIQYDKVTDGKHMGWQGGKICERGNNTTFDRGRLTYRNWKKGYSVNISEFKFFYASQTVCVNSERINLMDILGHQGGDLVKNNTVFTGPGVAGNYFYPENAGVSSDGGWTIGATCSRFDNGQATTTIKFIVRPSYKEQEATLGNMVLEPQSDICQDFGTIDLKEKLRYYSTTNAALKLNNTPVTNPVFHSSELAAGKHNLHYTYINGFNCVSFHDFSINVSAAFTVDAGEDLALCSDASPVLLEPAGNWSGVGVEYDDFLDEHNFNPSLSPDGPVQVVLKETRGACSKSASKKIYVYSKPNVSAGGDLQFCKETGVKNLNTLGVQPANGTWKSKDLFVDSQIDDATKTLNISDLTADVAHELSYSFTDQNGCKNEDKRTITIKESLNAPLIRDSGSYSCNPTNILLQVANPQTGINYLWYEAENGPSVFNGNSFQTPFITETKEYFLSSINSEGCESPKRKVFAEIREKPTITAGDRQYACFESDSILLTGAFPAGGTFSGTNTKGQYFNPKGLVSGPYYIRYEKEELGCLVSATKEVLIREPGIVDAGHDKNACFGSDSINLNDLNVIPSNGTWRFANSNLNDFIKGTYVLTNSLEPSTVPYIVQYVATDEYGCRVTASKGLRIHEKPETPKVNTLTTCGPNSFEFMVSNLVLGSPSFRWYDAEDSDKPVLSGTIKYNSPYLHETKTFYIDGISAYGCVSDRSSFQGVIKPNPDFEFITNKLLCLNTADFELDSLVSPIGGKFSGLGVSGKKFYPNIAGEGVHLINYEYTNEHGCYLKEGFPIGVTKSLSGDIIGPDTSFCKSHAPIFLEDWTAIKGGVFNGPGVENNYFVPADAPNNKLSITFEYNEDGCVFQDQRHITLISSPATPTLQGKNSGCIGDNLEFKTNQVANLKYYWYVNGSPDIVSEDLSINVKVGEVHTVQLETENAVGCKSFSKAVSTITSGNTSGSIHVSKPAIQAEDYTSFEFKGENVKSIFWNFGDKGTSTRLEPYHYYFDAGDYTIQALVTSNLGCRDTFLLENAVSVASLDYEYPLSADADQVLKGVKENFLFYPNPTNDFVNIVFEASGAFVIDLTTITGEVIKSVRESGNRVKVDLSNVPAGFYLLQISGSENKTLKIQKN